MKMKNLLGIAALSAISLGVAVAPDAMAEGKTRWGFIIDRPNREPMAWTYDTEEECDRGRARYLQEHPSATLTSCHPYTSTR